MNRIVVALFALVVIVTAVVRSQVVGLQDPQFLANLNAPPPSESGADGELRTNVINLVSSSPSNAWSVVSKLTTNYTGNLIRVIRTDDGTAQDIGFDSYGFLDTNSLLTFVGSATGLVTVVYDQIWTNHMIQATATLMPVICNGGNMQTNLDGFWEAKFDGSDDYLWCNYPFDGAVDAWPASLVTSGSLMPGETDGAFLGHHKSNGSTDWFVVGTLNGKGKLVIRDGGTNYEPVGTTTVTNRNFYVLSAVFVSDTSKMLYVDANMETNFTTSVAYPYTPAGQSDSMAIGRYNDSTPSTWVNGAFSDALFYRSELTADDVGDFATGLNVNRP